MTDRVDACHLSCGLSPAQLSTRMAHITAILDSNPHEQTTIVRGRHLVFKAAPDLEDQLRELVRLESDCCRFLQMTLERRDQNLTLTVSGDDNAQDQIAEMFVDTTQPGSPPFRRNQQRPRTGFCNVADVDAVKT